MMKKRKMEEIIFPSAEGFMSKTAASPIAFIILAAGLGTRMKSSTPKMLHELCGRSMLSHAVHAAAGVSPHHIVVVTGHQRERVQQAVADIAEELNRPVLTAVQEEQNGTGHAVMCGLSALPEDFTGTILVTTSDVPMLDSATLHDLLDVHDQHPRPAVTVLTATVPDPTGYGRIVRNSNGEVLSIVEQADASEDEKVINEVNSGVYAFDATQLRRSLELLDTNNEQGELYLTDVISIARQADRPVRAHRLDDAFVVAGVNNHVQMAEVAAEMNRRILTHWMTEGVTIVDPLNTWIDVDVELSRDVTILPGCQLHGTTTVAEGATIGPDCSLTNITVGRDAEVVRAHGSDAVIGDGATVGPWAYLRPGTNLGPESKMGTFTEMKNATIGRGTKVPHLSYVGDATVGEYSNIGAASVFVNYDGVHKHHTTIGSHVRMGSDTMYVAPVTVGDGVYSGAGTVIRRDVPPGALTYSDAPQRIVKDWVLDHRAGTAAATAATQAQAETAATEPDNDSAENSAE